MGPRQNSHPGVAALIERARLRGREPGSAITTVDAKAAAKIPGSERR
jgi:hypothetical protein